MPRIRVDLKRLPLAVQYAIAIAVAVGVMTMAWRVGRHRPTPAWLTDVLIPIWQWVGVTILFGFILAALYRRFTSRHSGQGHSHRPHSH
jgi:hypothetical protein